MKKILFYINTLNRGGAERVFSALANEFSESGYEVVFVTSFRLELEYTLNPHIKRYSVEKTDSKNTFLQKNIKRISYLRKTIKQEKPDFVLATSPEANFRLLIATVGIKCKKVITIISDCKHEYASHAYAFLAKTLYRRADGVVCQTKEEMDWFPVGVKKKCCILYNQVDKRFFEYECPQIRKNVVAVGRAVPLKRQSDIIRAFAKIVDRVEDNLIIYGDGPCRADMLQMVDSMGLVGRVFLPGKIDDVASAIYDARLFVHASEYEGMSNAVMEAMTLGIPCILTDCDGGGARELIGDDEYGYLVPVGNIKMLSDRMLFILTDSDEQKRLEKQSYIRAQDFKGENIFRQWRDYIEQL
ncbi:MAG: glycosyltransferase [Lachnospiraceae bacterium]|nr:glycosyltransferase [Lachnospiraceae bacterium]